MAGNGIFSFLLLFHRPRRKPADDISLPQKIYDNNGKTGQDDVREDVIPAVLIFAEELVHRHRHGEHFTLAGEVQRR